MALRALSLLLVAAGFLVGFALLLHTVASLTDRPSVVVLDAGLERPLVIAQGPTRWELEGQMASVADTDLATTRTIADFTPEEVRGEVRIDRGDRGPNVIYRTGFGLIGVAIVLGLVLLRRVVVTAQEGEPFAPANIRRLRVAGACSLAIPLIAEATERGLVRSVDVADGVRLDPSLITGWPFVLLGFGGFALAEIYRRGADLHDFDRHAI